MSNVKSKRLFRRTSSNLIEQSLSIRVDLEQGAKCYPLRCCSDQEFGLPRVEFRQKLSVVGQGECPQCLESSA